MDEQKVQAMSQAFLLQARGLNKQFGAVVAASDLNISIRAGERVSLIGSNGAGKTTFVNMITGYVKADSHSHHGKSCGLVWRVHFKSHSSTPA